MQFRRNQSGFTIVELLIVLIAITIFLGILFPIGHQLKKQSKLLSIKTDALRYQEALDSYYNEYECYPSWCPLEQWFDLSQYFPKFVETLCGEKMKDNPDGITFCEFNAQELTAQNRPSIQFFLSTSKNTSTITKLALSKAPVGAKIYGTKVLFFIPEE